MEWLPSARALVANEAELLVSWMAPEIGVLPSKNWTAPVPVFGVTVAVKTRLSPIVDGFDPEVRATVKVLADWRSSTGLLRAFCRTIGQSLLAATKGECMSSIVTAPGNTFGAESR